MRADLDRIVADNLYVVVATVGEDGRPWASPVFFAPGAEGDCLYWVSSPTTRHSRNIEAHPAVGLTTFDSAVPIGGASAAYFEADARRTDRAEWSAGLDALNARLPEGRQLSLDDLEAEAPLMLYRADVARRFVLVRGGDAEHGNPFDITVEV